MSTAPLVFFLFLVIYHLTSVDGTACNVTNSSGIPRKQFKLHHALITQKMLDVYKGILQRVPKPQRHNLTVLEVGALDGAESRYAAEQGFNVISFEPSPRNYRVVISKRRGQSGVTYVNKACSDQEQMLLFCQEWTPGKSTSADHIVTNPKQECIKGKIAQVSVTTVDLALKGAPVYLLKIDTEGFDGKVLLGACQLLVSKNVMFIIFEFNPRLMTLRTDVEPLDVLQMLSNIGYELYATVPHSLGAQDPSSSKRYKSLQRPWMQAVTGGPEAAINYLRATQIRGAYGAWTDIVAVNPSVTLSDFLHSF
uniref:Methyltransferase FkbM domain-containing protein n=1 Tax=Eutreptiella gymnastica TaxID=73025 RepID=A0A6U7TH38_9EUGL